MIAKANSEHVEDFAFHPLGAGPDVADAVDEESGILRDAFGIEGGVDPGLDGDPSVVRVAQEAPDDAEPRGGLDDVVEVVDGGDVGEELVAALGDRRGGTAGLRGSARRGRSGWSSPGTRWPGTGCR